MTKIQKQNNSSGFIALLTVVIAGIILTMVMGISSLAVKQLALTAGAKEGSRALFAADAGIECALYWDVHSGSTGSYFDSLNPNLSTVTDSTKPVLNCAGNPFIPVTLSPGNMSQYSGISYDIYRFYLGVANGCADVTVFKNYPIDMNQPPDGIDLNTEIFTQVSSRGYNVHCSNLSPIPASLVERGIQITY